MEVYEGEPFSIGREDRAFLQERLRGQIKPSGSDWKVVRVVGHLALPSGEILRIRSPKASAASVIAWAAYVNPSLREIRPFGTIPKGADEGDVAALLSLVFCIELSRAAQRHGLVRRYARVHLSTSTIRGRIDFAQLSREGGNLSRLPCVTWERLPHTKLNMFFAAAVQRVGRDPVMRDAAAAQGLLGPLQGLLAGVPAVVDPDLLAGRSPLPRNEWGFEAACALARLVIRQTALTEGDRYEGLAFLVNLERLFELAVAEAFRDAGVPSNSKWRLPYSRAGPRPGATEARYMEVDLFCPSLPSGRLVVDAKYKKSVSSSNLQQMISYCFMTGAERAVLVFPSGHFKDRGSYHFKSGGLRNVDGQLGALTIDIAELDTGAKTMAEWREAGRRLVEEIVGPAA